MIFSISGCNRGSPPLIVTIAVFKSGQQVDAAEHGFGRNWRREIVVLVAISAGEIASASGDDVSQQDVFCGQESAGNHLEFTQPQFELF